MNLDMSVTGGSVRFRIELTGEYVVPLIPGDPLDEYTQETLELPEAYKMVEETFDGINIEHINVTCSGVTEGLI